MDKLILDIFSDGNEHMYAEVLFKLSSELDDISIGSMLRVKLKELCVKGVLVRVEPRVYKLK